MYSTKLQSKLHIFVNWPRLREDDGDIVWLLLFWGVASQAKAM